MTEKPALDVQTFLNAQPFTTFQWRIFALCFAIVLLDGFDTGAVGFVAPSLIKEWGVSRPQLGPVLSAALFGLAAGALVAGPLADSIGRKLVLVTSVSLFGVASLAASFVADLGQLTLLRCITGIGLGAAMPNAVTLMSEYCPERRRAALTNAMFCGFPLGAALGGFLAAWMIPRLGWRSIFLFGGVVPVALALLLLLLLPESVRYLIARGLPIERVRQVLSRIAAIPSDVKAFVLSEVARPTAARSGIGIVFSREYVVGSVMLWVAYFMGLSIFYALINWMPILLRDSGVEPGNATLISALFPLGGVGAVLSGWLMDRFNATRIVAAGYALTAVSIYVVGQAVGNLGVLVFSVFVAGTLMNTAQSSLPTLAAAFYPTAGRATGVAWMMGVGRFGGILGSFLVAELSRRALGFGAIFTVMSVPGVVAAVALVVKQLAHPEGESAAIGGDAEIVGD
jgi:AAHS family 4-hydroxybenzoate transporter-like MFS transporter